MWHFWIICRFFVIIGVSERVLCAQWPKGAKNSQSIWRGNRKVVKWANRPKWSPKEADGNFVNARGRSRTGWTFTPMHRWSGNGPKPQFRACSISTPQPTVVCGRGVTDEVQGGGFLWALTSLPFRVIESNLIISELLWLTLSIYSIPATVINGRLTAIPTNTPSTVWPRRFDDTPGVVRTYAP